MFSDRDNSRNDSRNTLRRPRYKTFEDFLRDSLRNHADKLFPPADSATIQRIVDGFWLKVALLEAEKCRGIEFYGVGCVIIGKSGADRVFKGYTGEITHEHLGQLKMKHAEEVAISRAEAQGISLSGGTLYSTLEPCSKRLSGLRSCTDRIIESGIKRVVFGAHEPYDPQLKIECTGAKNLAEAGIEVVHIARLQDQCLRSILSKRVKR